VLWSAYIINLERRPMQTTTIALFGAAGKVGSRIANALRAEPDYSTLYVEAGEAGLARLRERGLEPTSQEEAVREADAVILAVPDVMIRDVAAEVVPGLKSGASGAGPG
jgi:prephenate dehydrogenase